MKSDSGQKLALGEAEGVAELRYLPFGETRWMSGTTPTDGRLALSAAEGYTGQRELPAIGRTTDYSESLRRRQMMWINFHLYSVSMDSWQRERDMMTHLAGCELGQMILGQTAEQKLEFYTCTFAEFRPKRRFGVGICSEGHGLKPGLFLNPEREQCYFGFNSQIIAVDIQERRVMWGRNLDSLFYTFLYVASERIVLGLHEIGVVALSLDGEMLWSHSHDVVTDVQIGTGRVRLEFMDAAPTSLELLSGEVIKQTDAMNG